MIIQILSTAITTLPGKKAGTSYQSLEVAFKNKTFGDKVEGKKLMSFGGSAESFKILANAQMGEIYDVESVKNPAGFLDWVSAKKTDGSATVTATPAPAAGSAKPTSGSNYTPTPKSTYETPEERAKKQIYIVRQSSISNAIETLTVGAKTPPQIEDVIKVASQYEAFVFGSNEKTLAVTATSFDDLEDDIPN